MKAAEILLLSSTACAAIGFVAACFSDLAVSLRAWLLAYLLLSICRMVEREQARR